MPHVYHFLNGNLIGELIGRFVEVTNSRVQGWHKVQSKHKSATVSYFLPVLASYLILSVLPSVA